MISPGPFPTSVRVARRGLRPLNSLFLSLFTQVQKFLACKHVKLLLLFPLPAFSLPPSSSSQRAALYGSFHKIFALISASQARNCFSSSVLFDWWQCIFFYHIFCFYFFISVSRAAAEWLLFLSFLAES